MASKTLLKEEKVRTLCEKGDYEALLSFVPTVKLRQSLKPDRTQPIHYFAARGNLQAVRELVEKYKCNPECQNVYGVTPLHCASYCGRLSVVKYMINKHKCDANVRDDNEACPLAYTTYCIAGEVTYPFDKFQEHNKPHSDHIQTAKFLLCHTTFQRVPLTKELHILRLPLFCGSFTDFKQLKSTLSLKLGDDSRDIVSDSVAKCLEIALDQAKSAFVENILHTYAHCLKVAIKSFNTQSIIPNVFHTACSKADIDVIKLFFELDICKPDVRSLKIAIDRKHYELVQLLLHSADHPLLLDKFRVWSASGSMLSYIFSHLNCDEKLIRLVVDATIGTDDVRDAEGNTPLHLLCKVADSYRSTFIPAEYNCYQGVINNNHELPVHIACRSIEDLNLIKRVSSQLGEDDINKQDVQGNTPLHIVCKLIVIGHMYKPQFESVLECLKYLIHEKKCDVNITNNLGELPLHTFLNTAAANVRTILRWRYDFDKSVIVIQLIANDHFLTVNAQDMKGNTLLHIACKIGDSGIVLYLVSKFKCDLNTTNDEGCLPLHYALSSGLPLEAVRAVIIGCTLKCKQNNVGKTPLHIACEKMPYQYKHWEQKSLLDLLCDKGSVNVQDNNGNTPLHIACKNGDIITAKYLISRFRCDLDLLSNEHCLPLHYAVNSSRSLAVVKVVSGCTLIHMQNSKGMTPLHIACEKEDIEVVKYLAFEKKCFPSNFQQSSDIYDTLKIHFVCQDPFDIGLLRALANKHNVDKYDGATTPLHVACKHNNILAVKLLLDLNSDIMSRKDKRRRLPFHIACSKSLKYVKVMSPYTTNKVVNTCDRYRDTPLHRAFHKKRLDIVEFLLSTFQCDFTIKNSDKEFPIHLACRTTLSIVKTIVETSTGQSISDSINCQAECGNTPLHIACRDRALDIVQYLTKSFNCEPSMRLRNNECKLPVDYACEHSLEMVKLVSQPCTVEDLVSRTLTYDKYFIDFIVLLGGYDMIHKEKPTTLDIACISGSLDIVKYLIKEKGCTLSALKDNQSALGYACGLKRDDFEGKLNPNIVQFLIDECEYNPCKIVNGISLFQYCCQKDSLKLIKALTVRQLDHKDSIGDTPLHYACRYGCLDIIQYLVNRGCNQNIINKKGESALQMACRKSLKMTKLLINCDVNMKNADGNTPLHIACESKYRNDIVHHLVEEMNCDVKVRNNEGEYPLHIACLYSLQAQSLVQKSDINCQDDYGDTPLHNACYMRDSDMIQFLLSHQECRADILNEDGELALHVFFMNHQVSQKSSLKRKKYNRKLKSTTIIDPPQLVVMILQRYPASSITTNHDGFTPIDMAIMECKLKLLEVLLNFGEINDVIRERLLHTACEHGQPKIVHWLIDNGASTEVPNDKEDYPQHSCFKRRNIYSCLDVLTELGPVEVCKQDKDHDTILHLACKMARNDVLQYILRTLNNCKKVFSIQNISKDTPLHLLAANRTAAVVTSEILTLIECDSPNLQDKSGNTPLHLACQHGHCELAEHLITKCKCDPNIANDKRELPLHIAVAQSQVKVIELLASPKNVNECTRDGNSPLHIACQNGSSLEIVKLVGTLRNANLQNSDGDSPLHIVCRGERLDVALCLMKDLKCSVELTNKESETAFHILFNNWSYHYSPMEIKKSLLSHIPHHLNDVTNKTGDTILHIVCQKPYYHVVAYLVETLGCKVDAVSKFSGATALHFACDEGSLRVIQLVTQCDPTAQIRDVSYLPKEIKFVSGDTPLHVACRKGKINVIRHLLESGHSQALNYSNDLKELPIHLAVAADTSVELIELFIEQKEYFDCNSVDVNGNTPLHIMCMQNPTDLDLPLVIDKLKCNVDIKNQEGNTPLHIACQNKHISNSVVKVLCDTLSSDQIKQRNKYGNTALHEFLSCQHVIEYKVKNFRILLQIFAKSGFLPLESNDDQVFLSYLHLACHYQKFNTVKYLCKKYTSLSSEPPMSVLYEACLNCNGNVLQYILKTFEQNFDVNVPNADGDLPLHLAAKMKVCKDSTVLLVKKTTNINYKNNQGETPLHELYNSEEKTFSQRDVLLAFLESKSIDLSSINAKGFTPLHYMCRAGKFDDLKTVLNQKKGINANIQDKNGATLLHFACQENNFTATHLLLTLTNADPSIEDHQKQAPITLTTDPEIIKLLIKQGADPQPLAMIHKEFFERFSCEKPPPTPVKLLVIGYPSVGKTTLIQSLQNELSEEVISEHFDHTAGIVTTNFNSQHYGVVTFYDFAGQAEYYASHDAVLHSTIKNVPPIVLILVNLNESTKSILNQTKYWIGIMANRCSGLGGEAAHMILVGSHADVLESRGRDPSEKVLKLRQSVAVQLETKNIILKGMIHLNCTKSKSSEMSKLQQLLQQSTSDLREKGVMDFNSHCFYVFLLHLFKSSNVVIFSHILGALNSESNDPINNPLFALPSDRPKVIEMCHDLNEKGHIMFIEHPTVINMSWLILDKAPLLHEILGTLFSPSNFPQHCPLSYSTGVVPLSRFDKHFSTKHSYPSTLSLSFLSRMEYCREIKDRVVLESIVKDEEFSESERYYFFPNLVSLERPTDKWSKGTDSMFSYNSGWLIQCKTEGDCFSPHFIQALLLRLAFSFTPKKEADSENDLEIFDDSSESEEDESQIKEVVINRLCSVWKNGIYWMEASGVKTVVEVIDQNTLVLLMQCLKGCEIELVKRRSSIISMVLNAKDEFCSKAELREYFLHPKVVTHPLPSLRDIQRLLFSFHQVKKNISEKNPCVINDQSECVTLENLLYFEPFSELSRDLIKVKHIHKLCEEQISIFNGRNPPQGIFCYTVKLSVADYKCYLIS